jgi:hypothetical protein
VGLCGASVTSMVDMVTSSFTVQTKTSSPCRCAERMNDLSATRGGTKVSHPLSREEDVFGRASGTVGRPCHNRAELSDGHAHRQPMSWTGKTPVHTLTAARATQQVV